MFTYIFLGYLLIFFNSMNYYGIRVTRGKKIVY